jgi:hypothetical protein
VNVLVRAEKLIVADGSFLGDSPAARFGCGLDSDAHPADGHSLRIEHPPRT